MAYRILSLDGGGTWALIQVKALIAVYNGDILRRGILSCRILISSPRIREEASSWAR